MSGLLIRLVRFAHWHRRAIAAAFAALAVLAIVGALGEPAGEQLEVVVASRALAPGESIGDDAVALRRVPRSAVPGDAMTAIAEVRGKTATVGASAGTVLTRYNVLSPRLTDGSGRVLAPVRLLDADIAGYLTTGDRIDLVSATESTAIVVARAAVVVALPAAKPSGFGTDSRGVLVVVAVSPTEATALAQAATGARLSVALR